MAYLHQSLGVALDAVTYSQQEQAQMQCHCATEKSVASLGLVPPQSVSFDRRPYAVQS